MGVGAGACNCYLLQLPPVYSPNPHKGEAATLAVSLQCQYRDRVGDGTGRSCALCLPQVLWEPGRRIVTGVVPSAGTGHCHSYVVSACSPHCVVIAQTALHRAELVKAVQATVGLVSVSDEVDGCVLAELKVYSNS